MYNEFYSCDICKVRIPQKDSDFRVGIKGVTFWRKLITKVKGIDLYYAEYDHPYHLCLECEKNFQKLCADKLTANVVETNRKEII